MTADDLQSVSQSTFNQSGGQGLQEKQEIQDRKTGWDVPAIRKRLTKSEC